MAYEINININATDLEQVESGQAEGLSASTTSKEQEKAVKALGTYVASQTIEPFVANIKQNISQNIQIVTGSSDLQQRVNFGMSAIQSGIGLVKNIAAGATIGTQLGIGGTAGGLLGLALTAVNTAMNIAFEQQRINLQANMESYQLQQTRSRFGSAYNRTREGV